ILPGLLSHVQKETSQYLYVARMNMAQQAWKNDNVMSLKELLMAYRPGAKQENLRGFEWYYLWRLCQTNRPTTSEPTGRVFSVAFSPKRRRLAASSEETVKVWDLSNSNLKLLRTFPSDRSSILSVALSRDGQRLAIATFYGSIFVWDID